MYIHDDLDGDALAREIVSAMKECARHIGKIGPTFRKEQIDEMDAALKLLQNSLDLRKRLTS